MKQSAAGSADMGMMEDLQLAVSLHRLDDALTVLWANTAFYQMLGKKQEDFKESVVFSSCFSDFIQDYQTLYSLLCAADQHGQRQVKLRSSMMIAGADRMVEIAGLSGHWKVKDRRYCSVIRQCQSCWMSVNSS